MFLFFPALRNIVRFLIDESYAYDQCKDAYSQSGATFETQIGWRNVIGFRKFTPMTKDVRPGVYDDMIIVAWLENVKQRDGTVETKKRCVKYPANTDPNYRYLERGTDGKDANKDGKLDIGLLPSGIYIYSTTKGWSDTLNKLVFRMQKKNRVWRDINRDGYFNEEDEKLVTDESAMIADDMHIHMGGKTDTWSAGCQTMELSLFNKFSLNIEEGRKAGQKYFTYLLVSG